MSPFVTLDSVACRAPDGRILFENLTLALGRERTGLVGRNGVGKTSLLRLILGEQAPAAGAVAVRGRLGVLRQSLAPPPGATVAGVLGVAGPLAILGRIERGEAASGDLEAADWTLPRRVAAALHEVGLGGVDPERPAGGLSGGEMTRAALAALILARPDLILLDEPTNNLDAAARAMVEAVVAGWAGGALVVSHDRALLRRVDRIVELSSLGATLFGGDHDLYAARKAQAEAAAAHDLEVAAQSLARVERDVQAARERKARRDAAGKQARARGDAPKMALDAQAQRAQASGARQAHLAERRREAARGDLDMARSRVETTRRLAFDLPSSGLPPGRPVLAFEAVDFAWPGGRPVLKGLTFSLVGPERVALTGPNGSGKTSLIGLAAGALVPTAGRIRRGVEAVVLDQRAAVLEDGQSLVENFRRLNPEADDNAAHAALARFLFRNVAALRPAAALSGGERLRAALACVLMGPRPPRLIILDEPTNHLDLDSIAAIESALAGYDGALLAASHDEAFLAAVGVERMIALGG